MNAYPYVWTWRYRTTEYPYPKAKVPWFGDGIDRTGRRCRVVCRGTMNSAWIVFEDGFQTVTSRGGLRRAPGRSALPQENLKVCLDGGPVKP